MRRTFCLLLALSLLSGCRHNCRRPFGLFERNRDNAPRLDPAPVLPGVDPLIPRPAGGLPTPSLDSPDLPPPVLPAETRNKPPATSGKELLLPDPLPPGESSSNLKNPRRAMLEDPADVQGKPATTAKKAAVTAGVPSFTLVRDGIATGRKPSIDGVDSLRAAGYRTVVYLHAPNADIAATKTVIEKRGLIFMPIAIAADSMKASFSRFAEVIGESAAKPLYVCDDDGARTGSMWYAYFRSVEGQSDDAAQVRAAAMGLRDAPVNERNDLMTAVQEYLLKR